MATKIAICNMALGWLGAPPIASLTENRPEARYAAQYYDIAVEQCLRDHRWNFAQKRARLAGIDVPEAYAMDYENAYAIIMGDIQKVQAVRSNVEGFTPFRIPRLWNVWFEG